MIEMLRTLIEFATPQTAAPYCAFPSPAEDHQHPVLHIGDRLLKRPAAIFFFNCGSGLGANEMAITGELSLNVVVREPAKGADKFAANGTMVDTG